MSSNMKRLLGTSLVQAALRYNVPDCELDQEALNAILNWLANQESQTR